ncbi:sulfite dehydrogenase [Bradyrhizobium jicamae]|uniref:Sulfite dehydrogenase n=1 Tax=Bradyrhizobium jicamae TaxID=280332 RepID=A0ABS5FTI8_9BRAD|nr:sulfite dehydrogenase [Bradyrhizobium jicamae]MBR0799944.1 sulfite dehydrogenase [Bradyrhizobium jicamae]
MSVSRRRILTSGAVLAAGGLSAMRSSAVHAGGAALEIPDSMHEQGSPVLSPAYGLPSKFEKNVVRRIREQRVTDTESFTVTPLQNLHGIITPNGLHFERHHAGVPEISPDQHRLLIHGLVDRPLIFTMDDIMRFPAVSRVHFLECSGNSSTEWKKSGYHSVQKTHGLLSCCEWTGVPLSSVLGEVGLKPEGKWILAEGADGAGMTRSIPMEKALDDAMLAYAQNGEMLRPEQGYPLRLLVPGFEGNMNVKWLRRLKVGDQPWYTREETSRYTNLLANGKAYKFAFAMDVKSVVTFPNADRSFKAPGFYEISGIAWSGRGHITRVDVSVDGGKSWQRASLQNPVLDKCLTRFRLPFNWQGQPVEIQSKAYDNQGWMQPSRSNLIATRGTNPRYHFNAIQGWIVAADGRVTNASI